MRSSIVGVVSPTARGSGYCALPNGLIVTSLDVVGYEREVQLSLDDGTAVIAVVVRANVALDVALLMPRERIALPPLEASADARLGDSVWVLGRATTEPLLMSATIASTSHVSEGFAHLEIDRPTVPALRGGPLLDAHGRVLGLTVRPRRVRCPGSRTSHRWHSGFALPNAAFEGGLLSAASEPEEVLEYVAEYGCPRCDTIFDPGMDRCLECGALLPHRWADPPESEPPPSSRGAFAVRAALGALGVPATRARVGPRTWRFVASQSDEEVGSQLDLSVDDEGDHLVLRAPLSRVPSEGFESFYRYLLSLNDAPGPYRFSIFDGVVYLSVFEPVSLLDAHTFPAAVDEVARVLSGYRKTLVDIFGTEALDEHEVDG